MGLSGNRTSRIQYWNLPGSVENWNLGVDRCVWGARPKFSRLWNRLSDGDALFFYVKAPVRGVVGHGHVVTKFKGEDPLWPDEIKARKVIYPHRFEFQIDNLLDRDRWVRDRIPVRHLGIVIQSMGSVPQAKAAKILEDIRVRWGKFETAPAPAPKSPTKEPSRHGQGKNTLLEIGRLRGFITQGEQRIDGDRLDVVWKRVERSVPTYAFEVQIGGDVVHALGKLKHAFDLWNSKIFLVVDQESVPKVEELLGGTFHEIQPHLKVIRLDKLEQLLEALDKVHRLMKELGLE